MGMHHILLTLLFVPGLVECSSAIGSQSGTGTELEAASIPLSIAFIGDSLIRRPADYFNLLGKIEKEVFSLAGDNYPYQLNMSQLAVDGAMIADVQSTQLPPALALNPDAIILYWDTDVSDIDEDAMTSSQVQQTRDDFTNTLSAVCASILAQNIKFAVAGPGILGEDQIFIKPFFRNKFTMSNAYSQLIQNVTKVYDIPYLDIRSKLLSMIPAQSTSAYPGTSFARNFLKSGFFVSIDGEHPNNRGANVIASAFAHQIVSWYPNM